MHDTETTYILAELIAGKPDFRVGWNDERQVVATMTPEVADRIARLMTGAAARAADRDEESRLVVGAINLITAAARASFLVGPDLRLVPKVDLTASAADLDARDQANVERSSTGAHSQDVPLTDRERRRLMALCGGVGRLFDEVAAELRAILAERGVTA